MLVSLRWLQPVNVAVIHVLKNNKVEGTLHFHVSVPHRKGKDRRYCTDQTVETLSEEGTVSISV